MSIEQLRRKHDWLANEAPEWARNIWPRNESLNWFIKANRNRLAAEGAITKLGRDWLIDAERFPDTARKILLARGK